MATNDGFVAFVGRQALMMFVPFDPRGKIVSDRLPFVQGSQPLFALAQSLIEETSNLLPCLGIDTMALAIESDIASLPAPIRPFSDRALIVSTFGWQLSMPPVLSGAR